MEIMCACRKGPNDRELTEQCAKRGVALRKGCADAKIDSRKGPRRLRDVVILILLGLVHRVHVKSASW